MKQDTNPTLEPSSSHVVTPPRPSKLSVRTPSSSSSTSNISASNIMKRTMRRSPSPPLLMESRSELSHLETINDECMRGSLSPFRRETPTVIPPKNIYLSKHDFYFTDCDQEHDDDLLGVQFIQEDDKIDNN